MADGSATWRTTMRRDRLVHRICNFLLRHLATEAYRVQMTVVIELGMYEYDMMHHRVAMAKTPEEVDAIVNEYADKVEHARSRIL